MIPKKKKCMVSCRDGCCASRIQTFLQTSTVPYRYRTVQVQPYRYSTIRYMHVPSLPVSGASNSPVRYRTVPVPYGTEHIRTVRNGTVHRTGTVRYRMVRYCTVQTSLRIWDGTSQRPNRCSVAVRLFSSQRNMREVF